MPASGRQLIPLRATRSNAAILFVHGFLGDPSSTWRGFPGFLIGEPCLKNWDVFSFGYTTRARWDILGIWEADPSISILAGLLRTTASLSPLDQYQALAIIAHSMGGLVVQRALVDQPEFGQRVQFVLLFGTPSNGLIKAVPGRVAKQQLDDMAVGSSFLTALRKRWAERYRGGFPFYFRTAAGETDQFVPPNSSHDAFPLDVREVVPGNHLSMVKPDSASSPSVQLVVKAICQKAAVVDSAARALEMGRFQDAIRELEPNKDKLDQGGLVRLALALEKTGRQEDAVRLLEERAKDLTDVMGTLAGRYKRRWLNNSQQADGNRAYELYRRAYDLAVGKGEAAQAFYQGINVAFLENVFRKDSAAAQHMAHEVLRHCESAKAREPSGNPDIWRIATEAEARLVLGEFRAALARYAEALALNPEPWQVDSIFQQALLSADLTGGEKARRQILQIFRPQR